MNGSTEALYDALGPMIREALADPETQDIMANPDGKVFIRKGGKMKLVGTMPAKDRKAVLVFAAHHANRVIRPDRPSLSAILPETNARLKGHIPPVVQEPSFTIRRPAPEVFTLQSYIDRGVMSVEQADYLRNEAVQGNVLFAGAPGGGKTTLANAYLALPYFAELRVAAIEDDAELILPENNLRTITYTDAIEPVTMDRLVEDALRSMPHVLIIGEIRGPEADALIRAWNTGLKGLSTVHANSAEDALLRIYQLCRQRAGIPPSPSEIARAVNTVVFIQQRLDGARRVEEVVSVKVDGLDKWHLDRVA